MKNAWKLLLALMFSATLAACSSGAAPQYETLTSSTAVSAVKPMAPVGKSASDAIAPQDLLDIEVFKVPDLSKEVRVDENGNITLPLIGTVRASGLSPSKLESVIASRLEKDFMNNPQVNVLVKESNSNNITVGGAVNTPGVYPLTGDVTVTQAIAMAQGLSRLAIKDNVTLTRNGRPFSVPLESITKGQMEDPLVLAGDRIFVHTSGTKEAIQDYGGIGGLLSPFGMIR
ncbi:MAG: polysaccharide export protein [Gammaproteobacteria bacterium]|nr:polysaccharide export protein [Gammaproteobacteria bacterium]MBU1722445.1 polysaccharide export protein [Gammaproteobacteria bacterium]MBU2004944.1 polysaccharide export protein [Gammaproteobacteria bacterium]